MVTTMQTIESTNFGKTDVFEVVNEFPVDYEVWNIGRNNFNKPGYIPLAKVSADFHVDTDSLKALYVGDEEFALKIIKMASHKPFKYNNWKKYGIH